MSKADAPVPLNYSSAPVGGARKRVVWALTDQAIVSLGNLGTGILVGRGLAPDQFGLFSIILEAILFLNSLQAAWVVFPLSVRGAASNRSRLRRLTSASLALTGALALALGVAMGIAGGVTHHLGVWLWAIPAMVLWQFQETTRRGLMAHLRFRDAIWGDAISYLGQALLIGALVLLPLHAKAGNHQTITLRFVFIIMAATSAAGGVLQLAQIGLAAITRRRALRFGKLAWKLGQWIVFGNFVGIATGAAYPWLMGYAKGLEEVALYSALGYLMKFANPLMISIQGLIIPACAQANSRGGVRAAARTAWKYGMMGGALLVPYFIILLLLPNQIMWFLFKKQQYMGHAGMLRIFVLGYAMVYIGNIVASLLNALEQTKSSFVAQVVCTATAVVVSLPMTYVMGAFGAIFGGMLTNVARVAALAHIMRRAFRDPPKPPDSAAAIFAVETIANESGVAVGAA